MMYSQHDDKSLMTVKSIPLEPLLRDYDARNNNYDQSFFSYFFVVVGVVGNS